MRQLTFVAPGEFEWRDAAAPTLATGVDAIVAPLAVARCDLDFYIAVGAVPYPGPFAFGHEAIARVVDAGDSAGAAPGDLVVVPFQLSCGRCTNCRRGWTNTCKAFPFNANYGLKPTSKTEFGGALSDLMYVPFADHMLVPLPAGVDPVSAASVCDNIADGWRGVAGPLKQRPGGRVLVLGGLAQSVSLYAAGAAVALGAGSTLYLDDDADRRAIAEALGAETAALALDERTPDELFDVVVEGAGTASALAFAFGAAAPNGIVTSVAIHFTPTTPVPLTRAYTKGLTFHTGRVDSRTTFPDVLAHIATGNLRPEHVTHRVASFADAPEAMVDPGPKLVFTP